MEYMFEHKKSSPIRSFNNEEEVTPWDLFCCGLMFPTRRDIIQSNPMTVEVGVHAAIIFREKFQDEIKATVEYCSAIIGYKIMEKVLEEERREGLAFSTSNSVSESLH